MNKKIIGVSMLGIYGVMDLIQFVRLSYLETNWIGTIVMAILFVVGMYFVMINKE